MRVIALIAGLAGAGSFAQLPAYSQQYLQRLAGAVDALAVVVADFDASATDAGLSREAALAELSGSAFLDARHADMRRSIDRYEALSSDLVLLRAANGTERVALTAARLDAEIARRAWADFEPALPTTASGALHSGVGFLAGFGFWAAVAGLGRAALRRLRPA